MEALLKSTANTILILNEFTDSILLSLHLSCHTHIFKLPFFIYTFKKKYVIQHPADLFTQKAEYVTYSLELLLTQDKTLKK